MLRIREIRADHQINPLGLDRVPDFSWKLESDGRNVRQKSYCLEIAADQAFDCLLLKQEEVSERSVHVRLKEALLLKSLQTYYYRVRVTGEDGEQSGYSETGCFTTALLRPEEWQCDFISAEGPADQDSSRGALLRKSFSLKGGIKKAYALATAHGIYRLYLNGQRVGQDELTPGFTSYHKHLLYQMYDVTAQLKSGENVIGAMLGAGWYKGLMGFLGLRNNYGRRTALLFQMAVEYLDGSLEVIASDHTWEGCDGPVLFSEIYDGETYDAAREIAGWCSPMEEPPAALGGWKKVFSFSPNPLILTAQSGCRIRKQEVLKPKLLITKKGETVLDFGQNLTGWPGFRVRGKAGEKAVLQCFEILDREGNAYLDNLRSAKQTLTFLCDGREHYYEPHFTYQGFRYIRVLSFPGEVKEEDFRAFVVHSKMERTGDFECSNPDVNQLHHNILWSLKGNFLDLPTDCPQRNERVGWTGDAQIFCRTSTYLMDTYLFFRKWLKDVAADQTPEGGVPHVVPDLITGREADDWLVSQGTHSAAGWGDVAVLNPYRLYLAYGDPDILLRQYDSMKAWVEFMRAKSSGCIFRYRLQFGDWVALDAEAGSYFGATPVELTSAAYYIHSVETLAKTARIIKRAEDQQFYEQLAGELKEDYVKKFFDETGSLTARTQTAHIISLYFGLVPEEYQKKTMAELLLLLKEEAGHLVTGFLGTPYFTHVLSQNGCLQEAYELLLRDDFPSWLYQVKMGATTIWEHWDGIRPDGSLWSPDMNSFNHYAYGAIGEWLYRVAAGIEAATPGFYRTRISPATGTAFDYVRAFHESPYGRIEVFWQRKGKEIALQITLPPNTSGELVFTEAEEMLETDGISFTAMEKGYQALTGSGTYRLSYRKKEEEKG